MVDSTLQSMYLGGPRLDQQGFAPERQNVRFPTERQWDGLF